MTVSAGRRLGSYEIVSAIGAGGMGEVYRARDTKLNREVALKVLPEAFIPRGQTEAAGGTAPEIVLVQNWFEELKRLVPVK